jgi:hypothetical protein
LEVRQFLRRLKATVSLPQIYEIVLWQPIEQMLQEGTLKELSD